MKTFSEYVGNQKISEVASLMTHMGVDSKAFCESFLTHVRWAVRKGVPLQEAFTNEAWYNPLSWGAASNADQVADRGDKGPKTSWGNTARRVGGTVAGFGNAVKGVFNGQGASGHMETGRTMSTLSGAIKDIQTLKANLEADKWLGMPSDENPQPLMQQDIGGGMRFAQALDMIWKMLTNKMREMENSQQAGKKRMTPMGVQTSGPGTAANPYTMGVGAGGNPIFKRNAA